MNRREFITLLGGAAGGASPMLAEIDTLQQALASGADTTDFTP